MRKLIEDIDVAALTAPEAARLYRFFDAAESVAAAGRTMVLPIVDEAAGRRQNNEISARRRASTGGQRSGGRSPLASNSR